MRSAALGVCALFSVLACSSGDDAKGTMPIEQGGNSGSNETGGSGGSAGVMSSTGGTGASGNGGGAAPDAGEPVDATVSEGGTVVDAGPPPSCAPRAVSGTPETHFHHVHFNTV